MTAQVNQFVFEIKNYRSSTFRNRPAIYITLPDGKVERIKKGDYFSIENVNGFWVTIQSPYKN